MADRPDPGADSGADSKADAAAASGRPAPRGADPASTECPRCGQPITPGVPHVCAAAMAPTEAVSLTAMAATRSQPVAPVPGSSAPLSARSGEAAVVRINPSAFVAGSDDDLTGTVISERYEVMSRLTQGGMGVVYQARHMLLDSVVALKVLLRGEDSDQQRFLREARLASKINHPNTVYISDFGVLPDGRTYLVMEYLSGKTLGSVLLQQGPKLDPLRACRIAVQIARGLQAVHDKGIVHRDLKPDNVFLLEQDGKQDFVKIVDFGIAKAAERGISVGDSQQVKPLSKQALAELEQSQRASGAAPQNITLAGTVMGTPGYMAPEQIQGLAQDARVDQYALGCLLYEMLSGQQVFLASGPMTLMLMHASDPVTPLRERLVDVPGGGAILDSLDQLVCRLLSKDPSERFASMTELAQALEREIELMQLQRGERTVVPAELVQSISQPPASLPSISQPPVEPPPFWKQPLLIALIGLSLIGVATAGAYWGLRQNRGPHGTDPSGVVLKPGELVALRKAALAVLTQQVQRSTDAAVVAGALTALGHSRDPQQRGLLEAVLSNAESDLARRGAAAEALGHLGDRSALPTLHKAIDGLGDAATVASSPEKANLRVSMAAALQKLGDARGDALLHEALRGADPAAGLRAALLLCSPGSDPLRQILQKALTLPQLPMALRWDVLACLGRLSDQSAKAQLRTQAGIDGPPAVGPAKEEQIAALAQLARLGDAQALAQLRTLASRRNVSQLLAAHELAQQEQDDGLTLFRDVLADTHAAPAAHQLAVAGLAAIGQPIDARSLGHALESLRTTAAEDASLDLQRQGLADAIVQIVAREPALLSRNSLDWARSAFVDRSWAAREAAAAVLADVKEADALRLLSALLRDGDAKVRQSAARALGRRSEPEAWQTLRGAYSDADVEVRREALRATERWIGTVALAKRGQVGAVSSSDVISTVKPLFDQGSAAEQVAAAAVLLRLSDKATADKVHAWRTAEDAGMRRLYFARVATEKDELLAGLKDPVLSVRLAAVERLAERHGDSVQKEALPVLQEAVRAGGVEAVAAFALLARLGDKSATAAADLQILSAPTSERMAAIEAMARLPHGQAVPLLLRAARDPEPLVRRLVAEVAADLGQEDSAGGPAPSHTSTPGVPVLRVLVTDVDPVVRSRAESLLGRLLQQSSSPERQAAIAELLQEVPATKSRPGEANDKTGQVPQPSAADGGTAGPNNDAGGVAGTSHPDGPQTADDGDAKATARPKPLAAEPFARAGLDAFSAHDLKKAQRLLEKANALCSRDRKHAAECAALTFETSYRLGQVYEQQKALPEAMAEYQKVLHAAPVPRGKADLHSGAQEGAKRLSSRLGQVIVRSASKAAGKKAAACDEVTMWMRPGPALVKVDGKLEPIEVRAQAVTKVGACP